jgi:hypothetical protein
MAFASDGSTATLRVLIEPMVMWIWIGGGVACLGALIALWPRGRAAVAQPESEEAGTPARARRGRRAATRPAHAPAAARQRAASLEATS